MIRLNEHDLIYNKERERQKNKRFVDSLDQKKMI